MDKFRDNRDWTKEELSLVPGPVQLAKAVIKQWVLDGSPKCDAEAIKYWYGIIQEYDKEHEQKFLNINEVMHG